MLLDHCLDHGSNVNKQNQDGETPLHLVSRGIQSRGHGVGIARLLLERGVDVHAKDKNHRTALHLAALGARFGIARVLLNHCASVNAQNCWGETPLHLVLRGEQESQKKWFGIVWLLLERGADIHTRDKNHCTALHLAAFSGMFEISRLLLHYGANADVRNEKGETPLHLVSRGEYKYQKHGVDISRLLLECGVDFHAQDKNHDTALHSAAFRGRLEIVQVLLDYDASANTDNNQALTCGLPGEYCFEKILL
jgi:ankyrin repeat protein